MLLFELIELMYYIYIYIYTYMYMNQFGGLQAFEQLYGDCYAHVSTTVILKLLKTLGIVDDVRNIKDKDQTYINDLAELDDLEKQYIQAQNEDNADLDLRSRIDVVWDPIFKELDIIFKNRNVVLPPEKMVLLDKKIEDASTQIKGFESSRGLPTMPSPVTAPSAMPSPATAPSAMPSPATAPSVPNSLDGIISNIQQLNSVIDQGNGKRSDFNKEYNKIANSIRVFSDTLQTDDEGDIDMPDDEYDLYLSIGTLIDNLSTRIKNLPQSGGVGQNDWINAKIDISNAMNATKRKYNPFDNSVSKRLSVIEEQRRAIVGQIDQDGNITQPGRNVNITNILASQTRYYRQLYLFIIQHCGVNGGDDAAVFAWLVEQVNSDLVNPREMCNNLKGDDEHNLDDALTKANFNADYTKNFIQNEVINRIKEKGVKLQTIKIENENQNNLSMNEVFPSKTGSGISYKGQSTKTININDCWDRLRELNSKKLYAALGISVSCAICNPDGVCEEKEDLSDLNCKSNDPTDHVVTITSTGQSDVTIKNSWGVREGEFGKRKYPLNAFGTNNKFGIFSISFIDIIQPDGVQNAGKKFYRMKSKKNKGKSKKRKSKNNKKSKKRKNRSNKRVGKFSK